MYFNDQKKNTNIDKELVKNKILNSKLIKKVKKNNIREKLNFNNVYFRYGILSFGVILLFLMVYLIFSLVKPKYYLSLLGDNDITIYQGMDYEEPGYVAYDSRDNNYDSYVVVYGEVDTSLVGEYIITYEFKGIYASRTVTVVSGDMEHRTYMIVKGDKTMYVKKGERFFDPGVDVLDSVDKNLGDNVNRTGKVNENESGVYKLTYSVTNSIGITLTEERTVIVMGLDDVSVNYNSNYTNGNVLVNIGVMNTFFDYMVLPNGLPSYNKFATFYATENGMYRVVVHGNNGEVINKDFYISNIDREAPTGNCDGYYKDGKSYVMVYAADNGSGVSKIVFDNQVFYQSSIEIDREYTNPEFTIYDKAGNYVKTSCKLQNKNSVSSKNYVRCTDSTIYKGKTYSLTASQKRKLAAMAYNEDSYSNAGLRAVISHMANLYEYQVWSGAISSSTSFYNYISTTTWYSLGTRKRQYSEKSMAKVIPMIDDILGRGNRTLPLYVNNFDLFPNDIINPKNVSKYIQGSTLYDSIYGAKNHKFWCFSLNSSNSSGNLYGYSSDKYKNYVS